MERLNDEGQWIVLMGFMVCVGILFLSFILSQSTLVGQSTSEGVLEFPKDDIQDLRSEIIGFSGNSGIVDNPGVRGNLRKDISMLAINRLNTVCNFSLTPSGDDINMSIHFNNGVVEYDETSTLP
ncbi:MAG: hypothetical protein U9N40_01050 [Euryarchaeota archaeon]|nr:hypothetical protein [Euryarchaeota archaeon]